jgi:enoyl ACP reductase
LKQGKTYIVMGLLDSDSIAYAIGKAIEQHGGKVIFTVQNERMKKIFFDRSKKMSDAEKGLGQHPVLRRDRGRGGEVVLQHAIPEIAGIVHSIAFANPNTCLGPEFHTDAIEDLKQAFHISCASLATVCATAIPT